MLACAEKSAKIRKAEKAKTNMLVNRSCQLTATENWRTVKVVKHKIAEFLLSRNSGGSAKTARNRKIQAIFIWSEKS